ncbi:MAG: lipase family protein [Chloroflexota bacterium]
MAVDYTARTYGDRLEINVLGSNDVQDWVRNLQTWRALAHEARANRVDRAEALQVIREQRANLDAFSHIIIEGHSRGGAVAQQIAFEIANRALAHGRKRPRIYLFLYGSKRTGDRAFVTFLTTFAGVFAYRNRGDFIPLLPPWYASVSTTVEGRWRPVWVAHQDYGYARYLRTVKDSRASRPSERSTAEAERSDG